MPSEYRRPLLIALALVHAYVFFWIGFVLSLCSATFFFAAEPSNSQLQEALRFAMIQFTPVVILNGVAMVWSIVMAFSSRTVFLAGLMLSSAAFIGALLIFEYVASVLGLICVAALFQMSLRVKLQ